MTKNNYEVFKKFSDVQQAKELASILKEKGLDCRLVDNSPTFDVTFSGNTLQNEVQLKIKQEDFDKAYKLLEKEAENLLDQVDEDYYLFDFTNEELYEILLKPDEWSSFDYKLSQKILIERGQTINDDLIKTLKKQRIEDLAKPEHGQKAWIYAGYLFAIFGGLIGLFIGWHLWAYKKALPDGQKVYGFNENDRKHGRNIFIIGIIIFPIATLLRIAAEL